jgi:hypothetical protein
MTNRKHLLGLGVALALGTSACKTDKITEANNNPNSPTDAPSTALFTSAARNAAESWLDGVGLPRYHFLAQLLAEAQYPESDQYVRLRASGTSATFNAAYNVELQDLQLIIDRGLAANSAGLYGPAMTLKSWEFGVMTDTWGDLPYSEAFQASELVLSPKYDAQKDIYTDLFATLTKASTDLGTATNVLGSADPIYEGDPAAWRRFANSLRARHALRLVNVDPATASTQLQAAFTAAGGLITTNADNAALKWPGDGVYDNPWATNFKTRDDHRISTRLVSVMRDLQDPRIAVYAMPAAKDTVEIAGKTLKYCTTASTCYVGIANAMTQNEASPLLAYTSRPGEIFYPGVTTAGTFGGNGGKFPSYFMTAAEVQFIRAEAAERSLGGLAPGAAAGYYNAAIRASMDMWGISTAAADAYLLRPEVAYKGGVAGLKQIAVQKWLALYTDGLQAWTEFRRTCQPALLEPGPSAVVAEIPRRLYYSTTERAVNADAVAAAVERQGADNFLTHIYWDKPTVAPTYEAGCGVR